MKQNKAFTLIEMMVVVGSLAFIFMMVVGILINSVKSSRKINVTDSVEQDGTWVIAELRKNLLKAGITGLNCPSGVGSSLSFTSRIDGGTTYLVCNESESLIASVSAESAVNLLSSEVRASGCNNFVSCDLSSFFPIVNFSFTLSKGDESSGVENYNERDFEATVVVRE